MQADRYQLSIMSDYNKEELVMSGLTKEEDFSEETTAHYWVVVMAVFDNCCWRWVASALIMTGLTIYEEQDDATDKSPNYNENPVFGTTTN